MNTEIGFLLVVLAMLLALGLYFREAAQRNALEDRYSGIIDLEREAIRLETELAKARKIYSEKRSLLDTLESQLAVYEETLSLIEFGVYSPHFDYGDDDEFKKSIEDVRARQRSMIKSGAAVQCRKQWQVNGSKAQGTTMTRRQLKLTARAFNHECEAAIANARWNNVNAMEKRTFNAAKQLNKLNESSSVVVEDAYVALKLEELHLVHEYRELQKSEREDRIEEARRKREEQKLVREAEAAEEKHDRYAGLLEQAKNDAMKAHGAQLEILNHRIAELELDLDAARVASERATAMAQMTRSGFVYVISNIGSFGPQVVKIGLTRRLDPEDRVRELGDASVPFLFDTHALIYSDDAPTLEAALHRYFHERRINTSNPRKEFFRATLEEVEMALRQVAPSAPFYRDREAREYHETLARRRDAAALLQSQAKIALPASI